VSIAGDSIVISVTWQKDILGVGVRREEDGSVRHICGKLGLLRAACDKDGYSGRQ
jgi:hypothetical protein